MAKLEKRKLEATGFVGRVIVDLHLSETFRDKDRKLRLISRVYSVKDKKQSSWKLAGHSPRLFIKNACFPISESGRQTVLKTGAKLPHAYIQGTIESHSISDRVHSGIVKNLLDQGATWIAYDPYKVSSFCKTDSEHLPADTKACSNLVKVDSADIVYAYENGVLALCSDSRLQCELF